MTTASDDPSPRSLEPIARLCDVSKVYDSKTATIAALGRVTLDIDAGALTAVMGPSGSGKSTLMHVLAGLDRPSTGQVFIGEREITALNDEALTALRRRRIGFVFQAFNLVPTLTVRENILLPFELDDRKPTTDERSWIDSIVKRLGIADRMSHRPNEISGGQQQRTAIARALATRPDILFADEPTGNLDARAGREVMRIMAEAVRDLGQTILLVTHDPVVAAHANRVVFIADGTPVSELNHGISAEVIARSMLELDVDYDADAVEPSRGEVP
ncbi:ABC transporter ATP-binding protein [Brevibacterium sp. UCMA 11754]|uniref:ABC transporter ATP-binding protein n=1 Tax=Brevibacterium sp. UCMA 11754 TaxID=2749198 RepID=UPI001F2D905A|nr:ABC transporter ATP-binding protein [Brevibacterium sp. UCMA 11754]MCF2573762.1 ABC transporter ATP-binding protein [Brevibacterium sp. UCMA 11754]